LFGNYSSPLVIISASICKGMWECRYPSSKQTDFTLTFIIFLTMKSYFVYILTNKHHTVFYTGVTSDLEQRIFEHKTKFYPNSFTAKYNCEKLVYYEEYSDIDEAIKREKQLKKYKKSFKVNLITKINPDWKDLSEGWFEKKSIEFSLKINKA
jgi:putative endonuclease